MNTAAEERQSLWLLTLSPAIWAAHFLVSYVVVSIWCGKLMDRGAGLGSIRVSIIGLAFVALFGIALIGLIGWRKHSHGEAEPPHDQDTPEDRHRFLGLATLLLSGLSGIATIYTAVAAFFVRSCV